MQTYKPTDTLQDIAERMAALKPKDPARHGIWSMMVPVKQTETLGGQEFRRVVWVEFEVSVRSQMAGVL